MNWFLGWKELVVDNSPPILLWMKLCFTCNTWWIRRTPAIFSVSNYYKRSIFHPQLQVISYNTKERRICLASNQQIADPAPSRQLGLGQGGRRPSVGVSWRSQFCEIGSGKLVCEIWRSPAKSRAAKSFEFSPNSTVILSPSISVGRSGRDQSLTDTFPHRKCLNHRWHIWTETIHPFLKKKRHYIANSRRISAWFTVKRNTSITCR